MRFLRTNTAVIVTCGPFYDKTDGVTIETALTITNERITLTADTDAGSAPTNILDNITGATSGTANDLNYITGNDAGMMQLELAAADVNRLGRMMLSITDAANHVPVFHEFMVVNAAIYDAFFASSGGAIPSVAAGAVGGLLTAPTTANVGLSDLSRILGTALTETAGQIAAAFIKFFNKAAPTGTINSLPDAVPGAASGLAIVGSAMTLASTAVQAIWDAATSALTTVGSIGKWILDKLDVVVSTRATPAQVNTEADTALSDAGVTAARMGYVDNLNVGGNVASSAEATAIQNNTRVVRVVPDVIERPDSGTTTYRVELLLYDDVGNMEAPDSAPTLALVNQAGTDRSSRLDSATMALVSTGRYRAIYTADAADTLEQLVWTFSVVEGGATRLYGNQSLIVDTTAVDFTAADRTKLETLATDYTTARAAKLDNADVAVSSRLAAVGYTAPPTAAQNADAWTARNVAGGSSSGRTNGQALAVLRNKVVVAAGTMTVYDTDDTSVLFTGDVTTSPGDPISAIDPA